jgi:hypothetical protein
MVIEIHMNQRKTTAMQIAPNKTTPESVEAKLIDRTITIRRCMNKINNFTD